MKSLLSNLAKVQLELNAPKTRFNSFGKYSYRSCEDILEAVKPILAQNGLMLLISDEVVFVEGRYYIQSTVTVYNIDDGMKQSVKAFAREPEIKKGMDDSQITGTASSYARKYALNGMFCIDDTKDADTFETCEKTVSKSKENAISKSKESTFDRKKAIKYLQDNMSESEMSNFLKTCKISDIKYIKTEILKTESIEFFNKKRSVTK